MIRKVFQLGVIVLLGVGSAGVPAAGPPPVRASRRASRHVSGGPRTSYARSLACHRREILHPRSPLARGHRSAADPCPARPAASRCGGPVGRIRLGRPPSRRAAAGARAACRDRRARRLDLFASARSAARLTFGHAPDRRSHGERRAEAFQLRFMRCMRPWTAAVTSSSRSIPDMAARIPAPSVFAVRKRRT